MRTLLSLVDTGHQIDRNGIVLRTHYKPDIAELEQLVPADKSPLFRARWEGTNLHLERVPEPSPTQVVAVAGAPEDDPTAAVTARVNALSVPKLRTRAAELKVEIPVGASTVTMKELVVAGELKALAEAGKDE